MKKTARSRSQLHNMDDVEDNELVIQQGDMSQSIKRAITNRRQLEMSESESEYETKNPISKMISHSTRSDKKVINEDSGAGTAVVSNDSVNNDVQKYLKSLWSDREVEIIINLFHELDSKKESTERQYIEDNIMNYCMMKENKLNKYIEESSKFLQKP